MIRLAKRPALLKLISDKILVLSPVHGGEKISRAEDVFQAHIDPDFYTWDRDPNARIFPTEDGRMKVQVHEMVGDGTFTQLFRSLSKDLDSLCLKQSQIKQFCKQYHYWLSPDGYGTFFLIKRDYEFYVATVGQRRLGLCILAHHLSYDYVWVKECKHRLVIPDTSKD